MSQLSAKKCNLTEVVEKAFCVVFFLFFLIQRLTKMLAELNTLEKGSRLLNKGKISASDTSFK